MTPRNAFVLTLLLLTAAACGPAGEDRPGESAFDALAAGAFLPRDPWLEVADLYRAQHGAAAERAEGQVPFASALEVVDGWAGAEEWGAWGLGERTRARFVVGDPRPYELAVTAMAPPGSTERPQTVRAVVNGHEVGAFTAGDDWATHRLPVPPEALRRGVNELDLVYAYHLDGLESDHRPLALGLERLGLVPAGRRPPAPGEVGFRVYRGQKVLVLEAPGTYVAPLEVPRAGAALDFELGTPRGEGSELRISALSVEGHERALATFRSGDPTPGVHRLALDAWRGAPVLLVFTAEPAAGERFTVRRPRLVPGDAREPGDDAPAGEPPAEEPPPVVLIVLDAARPDHFGAYGYERETTPVLDALAAESLVYRQAVAECSYTLCSMPSLLSGLFFVQHGLIHDGLVLADEVVTLAEALRGAGYLTLGYTGNPNSSRMTGSDQGFDELYEIWKTHPGHITRRVVRRLRQADVAARPFFLMIHYVPPHEPYAPDPEFDVFGDPAYDGPVTSDRELAQAVYDRKIELDESDLAEMVALYDGNLRMADAAVGRVLAGLKDAGRYDDALVIVTSDHGEAFFEHGWMGHNKTIYEEMLRVPLIVKLPRSWEPPAELDLDRLVTLADVPATILRRLGLEAPAAVRGLDLLDGDPPERALYLRSAKKTDPWLGVRTRRWKAIWGNGSGELYDLAADPGETVDVIAEHPLLRAGLALLLSRAIRAEEPLRAGARAGEISEEDRTMLRALGYL